MHEIRESPSGLNERLLVFASLSLKDLATQNLRSKGSSNFTPDEDTGRISSFDGSNTGGGDEDDIFSFQITVE